MWVLLCLVTPPWCRRRRTRSTSGAGLFAGASACEIPMSTDGNFIERVRESYEYSWPKPRAIVLSFPHNPTTATVGLDFFQEVVDFAREHEVIVVHDNAYAELGYDGFEPPSILQAEGAKEACGRALLADQGVLDGGLAHGVPGRQRRGGAGPGQLKSYLDYGSFQPIQIAATVTMNEAVDFPGEVQAVYQSRRERAHRRPPPHGLGRAAAPGHHVRLGADPRALPGDGVRRVRADAGAEARCGAVARRGFRAGRRGVRALALIENEQRTQQALRNLKRSLTKLG